MLCVQNKFDEAIIGVCEYLIVWNITCDGIIEFSQVCVVIMLQTKIFDIGGNSATLHGYAGLLHDVPFHPNNDS